MGQRLSISEVCERLVNVHNGYVTLNEASYVNQTTKAAFFDCEYGEWIAMPYHVLQGHGHPNRGITSRRMKRRVPPEEIQRRLCIQHGDVVAIDINTYISMLKPCVFIDVVYGAWTALPHGVLRGQGHPKRSLEKKEMTCLRNHGVRHPLHSKEIQNRVTRSSFRTYSHFHWKTGFELLCRGSYEVAVVEWLNANQIDYEWQPGPFEMPNGRTYRPDVLIQSGSFANLYVEIKGYFRDDAREKWEWFHSEYLNSQLWTKKELQELGILPKSKKRAKLEPA